MVFINSWFKTSSNNCVSDNSKAKLLSVLDGLWLLKHKSLPKIMVFILLFHWSYWWFIFKCFDYIVWKTIISDFFSLHICIFFPYTNVDSKDDDNNMTAKYNVFLEVICMRYFAQKLFHFGEFCALLLLRFEICCIFTMQQLKQCAISDVN